MGKCYTFQVQGLENSLVPQSCLTLCDPMRCSPPGSSVHGASPGTNAGVGCHFLLQEIFPIEGSTQVSCVAGNSLSSESPGMPTSNNVIQYLLPQLTLPLFSIYFNVEMVGFWHHAFTLSAAKH